MEYIDILFGAILAFFIILGITKGFFKEVFGLIGFIGGIFAGILFTGSLSQVFVNLFPDIPRLLIPIISFIIIFIAVYIISKLVAGWFSSLTKALHLKWLDRLLGAMIGGLKGALLISFLLMLISFLPSTKSVEDLQKNSLLYNPLQKLIPTLYDFFSASSTNFEKQIEDIYKKSKLMIQKEVIKSLLNEEEDTTTTR